MVEFGLRAGLYRRLVTARMRSQLQYRLSFALDLIGAFLITFIDFLAVVIIFTHLPRLAGWTLAEVGFFYAVANVAFALADMVVGHLDLFPRTIRDGSFDLVLVRPAGSLFQVIASDLALRRVGRILQGVAVLVFALSRLNLAWTVGRIAVMGEMIVTGTVIYAAVWIMGTTVVFWTVEAQEMLNAFTYGGSMLASYPINLFGPWLRRLMAFVLPLAFVSYFPGLYVLNRPDPLGAPAFLRFCSPAIAVVLAVLAGRLWQVGVRHYRSTGS